VLEQAVQAVAVLKRRVAAQAVALLKTAF